MRLRKGRRTFGDGLSIAPLIDVVFLLIIFFMTVSQITRVEVETLELPEGAQSEKPQKRLPGRLIVNVHKDARIVVDGRTHAVAAFDGILGEHLAGRRPEDLTILLRGDRAMQWDTARDILRACKARGIVRLRLAVVDPTAGSGP